MKWLTGLEGAAERKGIGVFQTVAETQTAGQRRDADALAGNAPVQVKRGRLALHIAAQRKDHLAGAERLHALLSDAISRSEGPTPSMGEIIPPST